MTKFPFSKKSSSTGLLLDHEQKSIIREYFFLSTLESLSAENERRILEILELAQSEHVIDTWIAEVDHIIGHRLNLIDESECKNMQSQLEEHLITDFRSTSHTTFQSLS